MARPKKQIDKRMFERLCSIQCTKDEMCNVFECDEKTLTRWCKETYGLSFSDAFKKESAGGKISLRRNQFRMSENNVTMAIWLGKQYLGQRDKAPEKTEKDMEEQNARIQKLRKEIEQLDENADGQLTELLQAVRNVK